MFGLVPFDRKGSGMHRKNGDYFGFESMLESFFNDTMMPMFYNNSSQMRVDIKENDKEYMLEAELPGVRKEDINIEINDDRLTISVKKDENVEEKADNYLRRERRSSSMTRTFALDNVQHDKISAKHENGVLTMILPKREESRTKGRKIDIS